MSQIDDFLSGHTSSNQSTTGGIDEFLGVAPGEKNDGHSAAQTVKSLGLAVVAGPGEGVARTEAGVGQFVQAPAANTLAGVMGARAVIDRGLSWLIDKSGGDGTMNTEQQEAAQTASRYADRQRNENVREANSWGGKGGPVAAVVKLGKAMQDDGRERVASIQQFNQENNPELVRQQQAQQDAQGFLGNLKAMADNPIAFAHTMAQSMPDMAAGAGVAKLLAVRGLAGAAAAGEEAAAAVRAAGGDAVAQANAAKAAIETVQAKAVGSASTGGALSEAASSSYAAREGTYQQVLQMPVDKLQEGSERYRQILAEVRDPEKAREILANELADQTPVLTGIGTAAGTLATNKLFKGDATANTIAGVEKLTPKVVGKDILQEGVEEVLQGIPEDTVAHGALVQADPKHQLDIGGSIAQNFAAGAAMGAGGHGMAYAHQVVQDRKAGGQPVAGGGEGGQTASPVVPVGTQQNSSPALVESAQTATNSVAKEEPTAAEKALKTLVGDTGLDRVGDIDKRVTEIGERLEELNDAKNGYGPMFDQERQELAAQRTELQQERQELAKSWPKAIEGARASFTTEAGARIDARYALMDAADLVTSHSESLRQNPNYPQELQPRARDRAASEMQVSGIVQKLDPARLGLSADAATGAPIVGADGLVESGNARTIALKRIYQASGQKAEDYKQFLRANAAQFGITPESVDSLQKPVLVRVRTTPVNRAEFARQANASTVAQMSPSEQAKSDANRIDSMEDLSPDDNGDFSNAASRPFVQRFMARLPATEQAGMIDANGNLSTAGYARVRNAVMAKAYGDSPVLSRMTESMDDNLRNVSRALMLAAPKVAQMREAVGAGSRFDADITPDLMAAVEELSRLKEAGTSVQDALAQAGMFGDETPPEVRALLVFLADNLRRPRRIADFIMAYMDALEAAGDPHQGSLLGEVEAPTKGELLKSAERSQQNADGQGNGLATPAKDAERPVPAEDAQHGAQAQEQQANAQNNQGGAQGDGAARRDTGQRSEQHTESVGDGERSEWVDFPKDSGTIGIPRADMPQIKGEHRGALIQFLQGRGISHKTEEVPSAELKPTQAEFSTKKAARWGEVRDGIDRSVLVSNDGYILDGHHQWVAALAANEPVKAIVLDAPIRELMENVFQFPSVHKSEGASEATGTDGRAVARQDFKQAMADLADVVADAMGTRVMMMPSGNPKLHDILVRLFDSAIRVVGTDLKAATKWVKAQLKANADTKPYWNKITDKDFQDAALAALEQSAKDHVNDLFSAAQERQADSTASGTATQAVAKIDGKPYDMARDNYRAQPAADFVPADLLEVANKTIEQFFKGTSGNNISPEDRAAAERALEPLMRIAERDKPAFDQAIVDAAQAHGIGQMLAPVKSIGRAAEKVVIDYGGNASRIADLLRATVIVDSYDDAGKVIAFLADRFGHASIGKIKNKAGADLSAAGDDLQSRIQTQDRANFGGYADVSLVVETQSGLLAEVQINVPAMMAVKDDQGHKLYEAARSQPKTGENETEIDRVMSQVYDAVFKAATDAASRISRSDLDLDASGQSRRLSAAAAKNPDGSVLTQIPPLGGAESSGLGSKVSPSSDSMNHLPSGNPTKSSPPKVGTNKEPAGKDSGTFIKGPHDGILSGKPKNENSETSGGDGQTGAAKLSRGAGGGMELQDLQAVADKIKRNMPNMPAVHVLATPQEAPQALLDYIRKQGAEEDVDGALHKGELYLFASGMSDALRAEHVLAEHEAAHFGLRAILGGSLNTTMLMIYNNNTYIRQLASELQRRGDLTNAEATEEAIVDIPTSRLVKLQGWRKVVVRVRDWLDSHGFENMASKLGTWLDGNLDDQQRADMFVADLVRSARDYIAGKREGRFDVTTGTMLSGTLAEDVEKQEKWLSAEAKARGYADIDELAEKDYPAFEKLAKLWRDRNPAKDGVLLSRAAPAYTHEVIDPRDGNKVVGEYQSAESARRARDRLDGQYGGVRYQVREKSTESKGLSTEKSALSRSTATETVAERAEKIIQTNATTAKPLDVVARTLTKMTGIEAATSKAYDWLGGILAKTPEGIKAGIVADYGIPDAVIDQRALMQGRQRVQLRKVGTLVDKLSTLTRAESRVAYEWMNETDPHQVYSLMQNLPEESVKVLMDVQQMIDKLSREAVRLGQLTADAYERNKFAYLRRSYAKFTLDQTPGQKAARARAISVLGDQYKGRGLTEAATMKQIQSVAPEWWQRKMVEGKADTALKGEKLVRLERRTPAGDRVGTLPGVEESKQPGKLLEVNYYPAGEKLPEKYSGKNSEWTQGATFEVRDVKGDKAILWRDFTKDEREKMGEIDEARFAIAKTLHGMIHDVEVGRYLEWLAHTQSKKEGEAIPGTVVDASERYKDTFAPGTWVRVPDAKINGTSVAKYGKLAGRYIPGPVWNDLRQTVNGQFKPFGDTYGKILSWWKTSKTALSPAVHTNNIMSNFVMADWHDVTAGHTAKALRILLGAHGLDGKGALGTVGNKVASAIGSADRAAAQEIVTRYKDSGGDIGSWATNEIAKGQIEPMLEAMEKELAATGGNSVQAQVGVYHALQFAMHGKFAPAWESAKGSRTAKRIATEAGTVIELYQSEDEVFRLAAWLKAKEEGKTDMEAGKIARRAFMDYNINAPWVKAMRASFFPFIAYSYRAIPMMLETAAKKPHKMLKLLAIAGALNALGAMMAGGDDDDKTRKLLPEEKAGRIWGIVPKMIRWPWNDSNGSPVYLDIRRFIPVGDVFDIGQGHSAIPMPPAMQPGGPLAILGELVLNKQQFTGKSITEDTDTLVQKTVKVLDYLYKSIMPNLLGVPYTYATTNVWETLDSNNGKSRTDKLGRELSTAHAIASAFGVKLGAYPTDVLQNNLHGEANAKIMEIDKNISALRRELQTHRISQSEFDSKLKTENEKKIKVRMDLAEKFK